MKAVAKLASRVQVTLEEAWEPVRALTFLGCNSGFGEVHSAWANTTKEV